MHLSLWLVLAFNTQICALTISYWCVAATGNDNVVPGMQRNKPMGQEDFERIEGTLQQEMILRSTEMYPGDKMKDAGILSDDDIEPLGQSCGEAR